MRSACRRRLLHSRCGRVCPGLWTGRKAPCVPRGNGAAPCGKPVPDPAEFLSLDAWLAAVLARLRDERTTAAVGPVGQSLSATARAPGLTAKEYIETVAQELGKIRGRGLLLSPADAQLALSWHASRVPLAAVIAEVRRAARLRARRPPPPPKPEGLRAQLRAAAQAPGLAARAAWESLADAAEQLLAQDGGNGYWTAAVRTLKTALRELPRAKGLQAGAALRNRIAPRPRGMDRRRYQRSLQLMLLSASSERLGLPPAAFLL